MKYLITTILSLSLALVTQAQTANGFFEKGKSSFGKKEYKEAIQYFSAAIKLNPQNTEYYLYRSAAYSSIDDYRAAIKDCDYLLTLEPNNDLIYSNKGSAYYHLKEYKKAIKSVNKAIALNPRYAMAYNLRGIVKDEMEWYNEAAMDYTQAILLEPKAIFYNNRGVTRKNQGSYMLALEDYKKAVQLVPSYAMAHKNMGVLFREFGQKTLATLKPNAYKAIQAFNKAIEHQNDYIDAYLERGLTWKLLGKTAKAQADLKKAQELALKDPENNADKLKNINQELKKF